MSRCYHGHTGEEIYSLLGPSRVGDFNTWRALEGSDLEECTDNKCGPHGPVVLKEDLTKYIYRFGFK